MKNKFDITIIIKDNKYKIICDNLNKAFKIAEQLIHKCISDPTKKYEQVLEYKHKKGHSVYIKCYGKIYCNSEGKPI